MTGQPCCGIELIDARGDNDGSIGDDLYFFGTPRHGIVVSLIGRSVPFLPYAKA